MLVTVHAALSLDGRIAQDRATTALSTPEGRRSAHRARAEADAVLVGSDTIRIDDPRLTIREGPPELLERQPLRVVLASRLAIPPRARLFAEAGPVLVIGVAGGEGRAAVFEAVGAEVAFVPAGTDGMVGLRPALEVLRARGVERLLVEGGSRILTSFFRERLVDRVELEIAMAMLGSGTPLVTALGHTPRLEEMTIEQLGTSVLVRGKVAS